MRNRPDQTKSGQTHIQNERKNHNTVGLVLFKFLIRNPVLNNNGDPKHLTHRSGCHIVRRCFDLRMFRLSNFVYFMQTLCQNTVDFVKRYILQTCYEFQKVYILPVTFRDDVNLYNFYNSLSVHQA